VSIFRLSVPDPQTVRRSHADRLPGHRGLSAWNFADHLSPLLIELHLLVALSWGLFIGLVSLL
jgi:hypothetical protein